ncbi:MAG TPA: ATP-binding protein [Candidatus Saccharimonadales bacterium]|nr:ATP-binding protein [Candidatus Saccharimonadales bacterium]
MKSVLTPAEGISLAQLTIGSNLQPVDQPTTRTDQYAHIEAIINAIHEPVLILDRKLTIQSLNKAFLKKFKVNKEKTLGINLSELDDNPQMEHLVKRLKKLSRHTSSFEEVELTFSFKKVGIRTLLISAKQISYDHKNSDVILLGIQDITQRRLIEKQKNDFVGYVTHELKTPLTSLSAFVQLLQGYHEKTGDKKSQFLLAKVSGQVERLTKLLDSFTSVYKAQTGMLELHKETTDLYEIARETVEMFQYMTTTHTISIEGNITRPISLDKERIRQVLVNLLINAIKYSPHADAIVVKLHEKANNVIVSVQDFGSGIPKEAQSQIFDRFFRVKGKNQEYAVKGLGLGLYIALEIIKAHGGRLWVESVEDKGATFLFSLPVGKK